MVDEVVAQRLKAVHEVADSIRHLRYAFEYPRFVYRDDFWPFQGADVVGYLSYDTGPEQFRQMLRPAIKAIDHAHHAHRQASWLSLVAEDLSLIPDESASTKIVTALDMVLRSLDDAHICASEAMMFDIDSDYDESEVKSRRSRCVNYIRDRFRRTYVLCGTAMLEAEVVALSQAARHLKKPRQKTPDDIDPVQLAKVKSAIAQHPQGINAKAKQLCRAARVRDTDGLAIVQWLKTTDEFRDVVTPE